MNSNHGYQQSNLCFFVPLQRLGSIVFVLSLGLLVSGCSEFNSTVTGKVYYDGKLLEITDQQRGMVVFRPVQGGATSIGVIDSEGEYKLSTGTTKAIVPGDYLVSVSAVEIIPDDNENYAPSGKQLTPAVYSDPLTSGITFIAKKGANRFDIKLKAVKAPAVAEELKEESEESSLEDDSDSEESVADDAEATEMEASAPTVEETPVSEAEASAEPQTNQEPVEPDELNQTEVGEEK